MRKINKTYIVISLLIIFTVFILFRMGRQTNQSPAGIYVSKINCKDTLKLYPSGKFEQIVYNENGIIGVLLCVKME